MVEIAGEALAPVVPAAKDGFTRYVRRDPLGLILTIAPWNYPYLTAVNTVVPGLVAGNAVILKAASQTILTGERFQAAMDKAGLPPGLFQHLVLGHDDTAKMLSGGHVDHVSFTGSVEAGGRSNGRRPARSPRSGWSLVARIRLMCAPMPRSRTRSRTSWMARFSTPGRAAAASSASMCTSGSGAVRRGLHGADGTVRAGRSARAGRDARADGGDALRRSGAAPDRAGAGQGRQGAHRCGGVPAQSRRHAVAGAAGADRGRPRHGCDDAGELRPRGRH